ncbi:MAG: cystathionine beta-lyase, partial [Ruminococcus sp.]|nr:cystathionine beta-lyase [Ruminococcus sp.]
TDECGEPNAFAVQVAVTAFRYGGEWLDELRKYIYGNKQFVKKFLSENIPEIKPVISEATYLLWLDCSDLNINSKELAGHIRKSTGLYLSDGVQFGNGENFLRMNIACPRTIIEDGLSRLKKSVEML